VIINSQLSTNLKFLMGNKKTEITDRITNLQYYGIDVDTRELWLHSYPDSTLPEEDEEPGICYRITATFIKNLFLLDHLGNDSILIHVMLCGGSWNFGIAIYDAIRAVKSNTIVVAHAYARSMSTVIPQAANLRLIMPNADVLIHFGSEHYSGNYMTVQAGVEWDKLQTETMLDIYQGRCSNGRFWQENNIGNIKEWLRQKMVEKQDYYMTAEEAVRMGFFDGVVGDKGIENIGKIRRVLS